METIILNILVITLIILGIVGCVIMCVNVYAFSDKTNHRYCKVFDRKQLNLWKYMHNNVFNFKYAYTFKGNRYFVWGNYQAIIWADNGLTSVHDSTNKEKCVLCPFDKKYSRKMSELLLNCVGVPDDEKDLYDPTID